MVVSLNSGLESNKEDEECSKGESDAWREQAGAGRGTKADVGERSRDL